MPGIEIKGRSKIANYRHGGRAGFAHGFSAVKKFAKRYHKKEELAEDTKKGKFPETESLTHQVGPYVGDVGSERKSTKWITKKDKPTEWITKKDKPTEWITKKDKPTEWITQKVKRRSIGLRRKQGKVVVPRRLQPPHKETEIPSRLDSPRRKKGKYRSPKTPKPEWSLNKWGFKEGGKADKKR